MVVLYGIKNCDTVKKARSWLDNNGIEYKFHDYRVDGLAIEQLQSFAAGLGWDAMLNRSSSSWRQLSLDQQRNLDEAKALELMLALPTLIKRPILEVGNELIIGFKPDQYHCNLHG
jgi:arsenate reductase